MNANIVVVGSGPGGLGFAALAAKKGYSVTVLEAGANLGGSPQGFEEQGFHFQTGEPWLMLPHVFENFYSLLGVDAGELLDLAPLDPAYRVFLQGEGRSFDFYSDKERDSATYDMLEAGAGQQFKLHLERASAQYQTATRALLYKNLDSGRELRPRHASAEVLELGLTQTWTDSLARHFHQIDVQKIMQYPALLLGMAPAEAPALFGALAGAEYAGGTRHPRGGAARISRVLACEGADLGVTYRTNAAVSKILTRRGPAVRGVQLQDGGVLNADIVVSDLNIESTDSLLPDAYGSGPKAARAPGHSRFWSKRPPAPGTLRIFLGVRGGLPSLAHHNLLLSRDWKAFFTGLMGQPTTGFDPSLYIGVPSKTDHGLAPEGSETVVITMPVAGRPPTDANGWQALADEVIVLLEAELDIPDLRSRIVVRNVRHGPSGGARGDLEGPGLFRAGGPSGGVWPRLAARHAWLGATNVSRHVDGLYFVGSDTGPALGLPGRLIAAQLAYKRVIGDQSSGRLDAL